MPAHRVIQCALAVVPERRMPKIVDQACCRANLRIDRVGLEERKEVVQTLRNPNRNLRYLQGMRQSISEEIRFMPGEDLRFSL